MGSIDLITPGAKHAFELAALGAETFCQSYGRALDASELKAYVGKVFSVDQILGELSDPKIHYCIALIDDAICAYAKLVPSPVPESVTVACSVELQRLYVAPGHWGQGIGSRLMTRVIDLARAWAFQHIWLRVWQENLQAIDFYNRRGFVKVGSEPYHVGACSETVLVMTRSL